MVASVAGWDGEPSTFERVVGAAVEDAVARTIDTGVATPLYVVWRAVIEHSGSIGRGRALDLWDRVDSEQTRLRNLSDWRHVAPVLLGTVTSIWSDLARVTAVPPAEEVWLDAVGAALGAGARPGTRKFDSLTALLELVSRVFVVGESSGAPNVLAKWRGIVRREARIVSRWAACQEAEDRPMTFPDIAGEAATARDPDVERDVARFTLCLYADSVSPIDGADPIGCLAERLATGPTSAGAATRDSGGHNWEPAGEVRAVERLLHFLVAGNGLFAELLCRRIKYRPWRGERRDPAVDAVRSFDQKMLFLGPPGAGKSSFLFASAARCTASGAPDARVGRFPRVELHHARGKIEDAIGRWSAGDKSWTDHFDLTADVAPVGLCSFRIVDTPGERFMGHRARKGGPFHGDLPRHVERIRPSILLVMTCPRVPDGRPDDEAGKHDVEEGLRRTLQKLSAIGVGSDIPIYIIVNKTDEHARLSRDAADASVRSVFDALSVSTFELGPYFFDAEGKAVVSDTGQVLRNMLYDPDLTRGMPPATGVAVRELIRDVFRDCEGLFEQLRSRKFLNVALTFSDSRPVGDDGGDRLGVAAFWSHLWTRVAGTFKEPLRVRAREFVENLRENVKRVGQLREEKGGLRLTVALEDSAKDVEARSAWLDVKQSAAETLARDLFAKFDPAKGFEKTVREHSQACRKVLSITEDVAGEVAVLNEEWKKRFRRLIYELNVSPDLWCNKFERETLGREEQGLLDEARGSLSSEPVDDREAWAAVRSELERVGMSSDSIARLLNDAMSYLKEEDGANRKRLTTKQIHAYFGALHDSSLYRNAYSRILVDGSGRWAGDGHRVNRAGGVPLVKHVRDAVDAQVAGGVGGDREAWQHVAGALWLVSDYGFGKENETCGNCPDYDLLSVRLFDGDKFRLRALARVRPEQRVGRAIELLEKLTAVRRELIPAGSEQKLPRLVTEVRSLLLGFVAGNVLQAMNFKLNRLEKDRKEVVEELRAVKQKLASARAGLLDGITAQSKERKEALSDARKIVSKYSNQGFAQVLVERDPEKFVSFVVGAIESTEGAALTVLRPRSRILEALQRCTLASSVYNEAVETYIEETRKIFMDYNYCYLEEAGVLVGLQDGGARVDALRRNIDGVRGVVQIGNANNNLVAATIEGFDDIMTRLGEGMP